MSCLKSKLYTTMSGVSKNLGLPDFFTEVSDYYGDQPLEGVGSATTTLAAQNLYLTEFWKANEAAPYERVYETWTILKGTPELLGHFNALEVACYEFAIAHAKELACRNNISEQPQKLRKKDLSHLSKK